MFNRRAGALAACALAVCPLFAALSRLAMLDTGLTAALLIAMLGFWRFLHGGGFGALFLFYFGCGLGILAKGPLGLALPVIAVGGYVVVSWNMGFLWRMKPLPGALIVLAVAGAWAVPAGLATQGGYFYELVWERTLVPIFSPMQGHGGGDIAGYLASLPVYIPILLVSFLPWTCWLAPMTRNLLRAGPDATEPPAPAPERGRLALWVLAWRHDRPAFLGGWLLAQLAAFSLVRSKLPHHILPLLPALALASGWLWDRAIAWSGRPMLYLRRSVGAVLAVSGVAVAAALAAAPLALGFGARGAWFVPAALASLACGLLPLRHVVRRPARAAAQLTAWALIVIALLFQTALPALEPAKSARPIVAALRARYGYGLQGLRLGAKDYREKSLSFYGRVYLAELDTAEDVSDFFSAPGPAAVVVSAEALRKLVAEGFNAPHQTLFDRVVFIPENGVWRRVLVLAKP